MDSNRELLTYVDAVEGFEGYVAFAGHEHRLAAGGLRMQPGLGADIVAGLAEAMQKKERLLGLAVDGAKAGIDYDPRSPGSREALRRFLGFLRPHLLDRLSLGPDLGTTWGEIEDIAREEGLLSVKAAVARAQGLDEHDFRRRLAVLDVLVGGLTVGQRRAGHALAHAALSVIEAAGGPDGQVRAGLQGFGTLGRGTMLSLAEAGVAVVSVADEDGCIVNADGLDAASLLCLPQGDTVRRAASCGSDVGAPEVLLETPVDVLVLAACEDAVAIDQARSLPARAVVVGANLGLSEAVERLLHARGIVVVPDFVGGCGGSASMDALFGPPSCPSAAMVLDHVAARMHELVFTTLEVAATKAMTPREAALSLGDASAKMPPGSPPYGHWKPRSAVSLPRSRDTVARMAWTSQ